MSSTVKEIVMRITRIACLTGVAAAVLAGYASLAQALTPQIQTHVLTLRLPDGRIEQVRYVGDVPPTVTPGSDPVAASFEPMSAFAMMDRISAAMDRQAEALLRSIDTARNNTGPNNTGPNNTGPNNTGPNNTGPGNTGPGVGGFGLIPAMSGPGVCMRSVQITYTGNGQPHVVSQTSGDCGPAGGQATPATLPNPPAPKPAPNLVEAKNTTPWQPLLHVVSDWQR
jgi:hypothetical protein